MRKLIAIGVTLVLVAGCGDSKSDSPSTTSTLATSTTTASAKAAESDQVSAIGVLLAALVVRDGDIEQAVADALITVQEVENAIVAIEEDTLSEWVSLADGGR